MNSTFYMNLAIAEAKKALYSGDIPVGAVIVYNDEVIGRGYNRREQSNNTLGHAELDAISMACDMLNNWRLSECDLYVTLEPCPMCAGAIINARIKRVFFGAYQSNYGSFGTVADFAVMGYPHSPEIHGGVMEKECAELIKSTKFERLKI